MPSTSNERMENSFPLHRYYLNARSQGKESALTTEFYSKAHKGKKEKMYDVLYISYSYWGGGSFLWFQFYKYKKNYSVWWILYYYFTFN